MPFKGSPKNVTKEICSFFLWRMLKVSKVHVSSFGPYFTENKDVHVELISDGSCRTVILITGVEEMVVMQEWY